MKEDFLHYLWKYKLYNTSPLKTVEGQNLEVLNPGILNLDAGPDFFNGKIKIQDTIWAGNIEIHVKSSDWIKHQHQTDKAYDNVILHVVYEDDKPVIDKNGNSVPTLALKGIINTTLLDNYTNLLNSKDWIPCGNQIKNSDSFTFNNFLDRLIIERLERKSEEILQTLSLNKNDWEETFYQYLFKYFGLNVNAAPFHLVAKNTPLKIIDKHHALESVEALLYGQAGMLEGNTKDVYHENLKKEYQFLRTKFKLEAIDNSLWKLLRLRPSNFPTIRISQLSNLLLKKPRIFSNIIAANSIKEIQELFEVSASKYWDNHYQFGKITEIKKKKKLGAATINNIIINVVVPFIFVYSEHNGIDELRQKAFSYLEKLPAEKNTIIKKWKELSVISTNAMQSQSLLELKNNYCFQKKCLNCSVGNNILRND